MSHFLELSIQASCLFTQIQCDWSLGELQKPLCWKIFSFLSFMWICSSFLTLWFTTCSDLSFRVFGTEMMVWAAKLICLFVFLLSQLLPSILASTYFTQCSQHFALQFCSVWSPSCSKSSCSTFAWLLYWDCCWQESFSAILQWPTALPTT